jgi:ATP-binding cassette subfamily B protein
MKNKTLKILAIIIPLVLIGVMNIARIEVKNLDFRFNGRSKLLNDVSLKLEKGKITCLLGESGSGKTTFAEILQKNYIQEKGEIIINRSINLNEISISNWRKHISVVPQNIQLFNGTVLENIILDEHLDEQKLQSVINLGFEKFINSLPQNILTIVGEEGVNLSGGQKQLLGWMRALYHNPQFLILDEPTSSLDKENRDFIYKLIDKLKDTTIIFIISHHLEDLKNISTDIYLLKDTRLKII